MTEELALSVTGGTPTVCGNELHVCASDAAEADGTMSSFCMSTTTYIQSVEADIKTPRIA